MSDTRLEHDSFGDIAVPADRRWGAQTQRSLEHFAIGVEKFTPDFIRALALVKKAAALANVEFGVVAADVGAAIVDAADAVIAGDHDDEFPLSVWQTGSGTQTNMNMNEVLAHLASARLGKRVHPNDDVNRSQSSNDVFPTAMHVAVADTAVRALVPALQQLRGTLADKAIKNADVVKLGRTHLQDAVPMTLGQELSGHVRQLELAVIAVEAGLSQLYELAIGGTAVGTGLNAPAGYGHVVSGHLAALTGLPFVVAQNPFAALAGHEPLVFFHGALKTAATALMKLANDVRWLSSGPRGGLGEIKIPENEPGSSIMPGKVNPTQGEALAMVCAQVFGNDVVVNVAGAAGNFQLNVMKPVIVHNVLQSLRLLRDAVVSFDVHCARGIVADAARMSELMRRSLMLVTALAPVVGYETAAAVAKRAHADGTTLKEAARALGVLDDATLDRLLDPRPMLSAASPASAGRAGTKP